MSASESHVTELLTDLQAGNDEAADRLFEVLYDELRRLARGKRKRWKGDPSLQTTALVHEAYLKLIGDTNRTWENRSHFFAVAARAIRQILLNEARRRQAQKRGGNAPDLSLENLQEILDPAGDEAADRDVTTAEEARLLVQLDEALDRFANEYPRAARGVECRFFGGMTIEETAEALDVSASTVSRDWTLAKAWLYREIKRMRGGDVKWDLES